MKLAVKVVPKSSRNQLAGWIGDALKVCVTAAPEKGRANAAVEEILAESLNVKKDAVRIVAGHASTRKLIEIEGLDEIELRARLRAVMAKA